MTENLQGSVGVITEDRCGPRAASARFGPHPHLAYTNQSYQNFARFNQPGAERERQAGSAESTGSEALEKGDNYIGSHLTRKVHNTKV